MVEQPDLLVQRGPPVLRTRLLLLPPSGRRRGPASLGRREPLAQRDGVPSEVLLWNTQNLTGGEHFTANIYPSFLKWITKKNNCEFHQADLWPGAPTWSLPVQTFQSWPCSPWRSRSAPSWAGSRAAGGRRWPGPETAVGRTSSTVHCGGEGERERPQRKETEVTSMKRLKTAERLEWRLITEQINQPTVINYVIKNMITI